MFFCLFVLLFDCSGTSCAEQKNVCVHFMFGTYQKDWSDSNYQVQSCTKIGQTGFLLGEQLLPLQFGNLFRKGHDTRNTSPYLQTLYKFSLEGACSLSLLNCPFFLDSSWYSISRELVPRKSIIIHLPVARRFHFIVEKQSKELFSFPLSRYNCLQ